MTALFEIAAGPRATQTVDSVDAIAPQLVAFVRGAARWLDPWFPQRGLPGPGERGSWTDHGVTVAVQQVEELSDGRGLRIIHLRRGPSGDAHQGAIRVVAVGLGRRMLELRWNFVAGEHGLRGSSAELTVDGDGGDQCVADFRRWFGP
jgi:hypothetical protein